MKIGLLTHSVNPRGGVVHTIELAHALFDAGHNVTVMAPAMPGQRFFRPVRCATELVPVAPAPNAAPIDMVAMVGSRIAAYVDHLTPLLEREAFDVLHCHDGIGGNALATLQDRGLIDGFVRTVHHLDNFAQPQLMAWQHRSVHQARQVLCVSRVWQGVLAGQGIAALEVPNGVDAARFSPVPAPTDAALAQRLGVRTDGLVLLCVGGVELRKNTTRVLQAFVQLRAQMPSLQLVIAGGASLLDHSSYAREFHALLQSSGAAQDVLLTGPLLDADVPGLFRLADVVAMPSLSEGFGLVVLEALCSGVPVVVSQIAPFTEYLQRRDAHWTNPLDASCIASAIQRAILGRDPQRIQASALRLAAQFSWQHSAALHTNIYSKMRAPSVCP